MTLRPPLKSHEFHIGKSSPAGFSADGWGCLPFSKEGQTGEDCETIFEFARDRVVTPVTPSNTRQAMRGFYRVLVSQ